MVLQSTHANTGNGSIEVMNGALLAEESQSYDWYFNGEHVGQTRELQVCESGTYELQTISMDGTVSKTSITVGVSAEGTVYRIWTIGDSTVQNYADSYHPRKGWGQVLQHFFDADHVEVINKAVGGTSSKSFYEYYWADIVSQLQSGDYVFIQFGINDKQSSTSDPRYTEPSTTFKDYLTSYVQESQAKGAIPVLVSTLRRNAWNDDGVTTYPAYGGYPIATRELAKDLGVPLIDLDSLAKVRMEEVGKAYTGPHWYMNIDAGDYTGVYSGGQADNVHFQEMGAIEMAKQVIRGIELNEGIPLMDTLAKYFSPTYDLTVTSNYAEDIQTTLSSSFPAGLNITLRSRLIDYEKYVYAGWYFSEDSVSSRNTLMEFTMPAENVSFEARLDTDMSKLDCNGVYEGTAALDPCGYCLEPDSDINPCYSGLDSTMVVSIRAVHSDLCLTTGSIVTQETCSESETQLWQVIPEEGGYQFKNISTGLYLRANGASVIESDNPSVWRVEEEEQDVYRLLNADNIDQGLAIPKKSTETGISAVMIQRTNGVVAHQFAFDVKEEEKEEVLAASVTDFKVQLYPNPVVEGQLNLGVNEQFLGAQFRILMLDGKTLKEGRISSINQQIDLSGLNHGIYVLSIMSPGQSTFQKKIIVK